MVHNLHKLVILMQNTHLIYNIYLYIRARPRQKGEANTASSYEGSKNITALRYVPAQCPGELNLSQTNTVDIPDIAKDCLPD